MENMKSLADQIREELVKPRNKPEKNNSGTGNKTEKAEKKKKPVADLPAIFQAMLSYNNSANKSMVHVRFDEKTVRTMNQFKMATEVDVTKLVAFSVKHLFETYPELKLIIKQFIQNTEL